MNTKSLKKRINTWHSNQKAEQYNMPLQDMGKLHLREKHMQLRKIINARWIFAHFLKKQKNITFYIQEPNNQHCRKTQQKIITIT